MNVIHVLCDTKSNINYLSILEQIHVSQNHRSIQTLVKSMFSYRLEILLTNKNKEITTVIFVLQY